MTRTLLLLRHAKSDWADPQLADHDRPLNARGNKAAPKIARWAREHGFVPSRIVSSTALRARTTAQLFADTCSGQCEVELRKRLYLAPPTTYWDVLSEVAPGEDRVLFVGHNPGISEWASQLAGHSIEMPTAALGIFELEIPELRDATAGTPARLLHFVLPRAL